MEECVLEETYTMMSSEVREYQQMQPSLVQATVSDDDDEQSEYDNDKEDSGASE